MTVQEVMTANPEALSPEASIRQAASIMRDENIGVIPIIDEQGSLVGIITDRDIVVNAVALGHSSDTSVEECMTHDPAGVARDTTVEQAMLLMSQQQIRRLPVLENGRLIGIVSLGDLADSAAPSQEKAQTLEEISADAQAMRTSRPPDLT
jgi:CBS domain-containing protein